MTALFPPPLPEVGSEVEFRNALGWAAGWSLTCLHTFELHGAWWMLGDNGWVPVVTRLDPGEWRQA